MDTFENIDPQQLESNIKHIKKWDFDYNSIQCKNSISFWLSNHQHNNMIQFGRICPHSRGICFNSRYVEFKTNKYDELFKHYEYYGISHQQYLQLLSYLKRSLQICDYTGLKYIYNVFDTNRLFLKMNNRQYDIINNPAYIEICVVINENNLLFCTAEMGAAIRNILPKMITARARYDRMSFSFH